MMHSVATAQTRSFDPRQDVLIIKIADNGAAPYAPSTFNPQSRAPDLLLTVIFVDDIPTGGFLLDIVDCFPGIF